MDYQNELSVSLELARKAGEVIMKHFRKKGEVKQKEDGTLVTQADLEAEKIIINGLKRSFPNDAIVAEESLRTRGKREWHIDPLDGTGSFAIGDDEFTVHIGLCEDKKPVLGVVFRPTTNEMYYGIKDRGAYKIDKEGFKTKLSVKEINLDDMTAVLSFNERTIKETEEVLKKIKIVKMKKMGGTGLKIITIAENKADVFITVIINSYTWDICAPQVILEAAGGIITYVDGEQIVYDNFIKLPKNILVGRTEAQMQHVKERLSLS